MITVKDSTGTEITGVTWLRLGRWTQEALYAYHDIEGGTHGMIYHRGLTSARNTLTGRLMRTPANASKIANLVGQTITVESETEGTHTAYVTGAPTNTDNPAWYVFSLSLIEVSQ